MVEGPEYRCNGVVGRMPLLCAAMDQVKGLKLTLEPGDHEKITPTKGEWCPYH
jgi:hypothetical protein